MSDNVKRWLEEQARKDPRGMTRAYAKSHDVDPDHMERQFDAESRFNNRARSSKGAYGVAQLMPATAKGLGVNPRNPLENIEGGVRYQRQMLDQFNGDYTLGTAAYNTGPGNVRKYGGVPPFRETQKYVGRVVRPGAGEQKAPSLQDDVAIQEALANQQLPQQIDSQEPFVPNALHLYTQSDEARKRQSTAPVGITGTTRPRIVDQTLFDKRVAAQTETKPVGEPTARQPVARQRSGVTQQPRRSGQSQVAPTQTAQDANTPRRVMSGNQTFNPNAQPSLYEQIMTPEQRANLEPQTRKAFPSAAEKGKYQAESNALIPAARQLQFRLEKTREARLEAARVVGERFYDRALDASMTAGAGVPGYNPAIPSDNDIQGYLSTPAGMTEVQREAETLVASREMGNLTPAQAKAQSQRISGAVSPTQNPSFVRRALGDDTTDWINRIPQAAGDLVVSSLQGVTDLFPDVGGGESGISLNEHFRSSLDPLKAWTRRTFPSDQEAEGFFKVTIPQAIGSVIPFLASGTAVGAGARLAGLSAGGTEAAGMLSAATIGATSNAAQTYEEALRAGMSRDDARAAARLGGAIGALEALGVEGRVATLGRSRAMLHRALEALKEAPQEMTTDFLNNVNAKMISGYAPDKALMEGVVEAGLAGLVVGGLVQGGGAAMDRGRAADTILPTLDQARPEPVNATETGATTGEGWKPRINVIRQTGAGAPGTPGTPIAPVAPGTPVAPLNERLAQILTTQASVPVLPAGASEVEKKMAAALQSLAAMKKNKQARPLNDKIINAASAGDAMWERAQTDDQFDLARNQFQKALTAITSSPEFQKEAQAGPGPLQQAHSEISGRLKELEALRKAGIATAPKLTPEQKKAKQKAEAEQQKAAKLAEAEQKKADQEYEREQNHLTALNGAQTAQAEARAALDAGDHAGALLALASAQRAFNEASKNTPEGRQGFGQRQALNRQAGVVGNQIGAVRQQQAQARQEAQKQEKAQEKAQKEAQAKATAQARTDSRFGPGILDDPEYQAQQANVTRREGDDFWNNLAAQNAGNAAEDQTPSLTRFVRQMGGMSPDQDVAGEMRRLSPKEAGTTGLINRNSTWSPDQMLQAARSEGLTQAETVGELLGELEQALQADRARTASPQQAEAEYLAEQEEGADLVADWLRAQQEMETPAPAQPAKSQESSDPSVVRPTPPVQAPQRSGVTQRGPKQSTPYGRLGQIQRQQLPEMETTSLVSPEGRAMVAKLRQLAAQEGASEQVSELLSDIKNRQMREAKDAADTEWYLKRKQVVTQEIRQIQEELPEDEADNIDRYMAIVADLKQDANAVELLEAAAMTETAEARQDFLTVAGDVYGFTEQDADDLIEGTRLVIEQRRQDAEQIRQAGKPAARSRAPRSRQDDSPKPERSGVTRPEPEPEPETNIGLVGLIDQIDSLGSDAVADQLRKVSLQRAQMATEGSANPDQANDLHTFEEALRDRYKALRAQGKVFADGSPMPSITELFYGKRTRKQPGAPTGKRALAKDADTPQAVPAGPRVVSGEAPGGFGTRKPGPSTSAMPGENAVRKPEPKPAPERKPGGRLISTPIFGGDRIIYPDRTPEGKTSETKAADSERQAVIDEIMELAKKPLPEIVPVYEQLGTDGKWYVRAQFPGNVTSAGQRRLGGYAFRRPDGTTVGTRRTTEQELIDEFNRTEESSAGYLRESLSHRDEEELAEALEYWRETAARKARLEGKTPETKDAGAKAEPENTAERRLVEAGHLRKWSHRSGDGKVVPSWQWRADPVRGTWFTSDTKDGAIKEAQRYFDRSQQTSAPVAPTATKPKRSGEGKIKREIEREQQEELRRRLDQAIMIAADSLDKLRPQDVARVLEEAPDDIRDTLQAYLQTSDNPRVVAEARTWELEDLGDVEAATEAEPDRQALIDEMVEKIRSLPEFRDTMKNNPENAVVPEVHRRWFREVVAADVVRSLQQGLMARARALMDAEDDIYKAIRRSALDDLETKDAGARTAPVTESKPQRSGITQKEAQNESGIDEGGHKELHGKPRPNADRGSAGRSDNASDGAQVAADGERDGRTGSDGDGLSADVTRPSGRDVGPAARPGKRSAKPGSGKRASKDGKGSAKATPKTVDGAPTEQATVEQLFADVDAQHETTQTGEAVIQAAVENLPPEPVVNTTPEPAPEPKPSKPVREVRQSKDRFQLGIWDYTIDANAIQQMNTGGQIAKFNQNIEAINLVNKLAEEQRTATPAEQATLALYAGWGGIKNVFYPYESAAHHDRNVKWVDKQGVLRKLITPEEYQDAQDSTKNAHYTSPELIGHMWTIADRLGFKKGRILEPSMGIGSFFGMAPADIRARSSWTGVEKDTLTGRMAKQLYPSANITIDGFENVAAPDGFFDIAIGNVPFGSYQLSDARYNKFGANVHNYFFLKSIDKVRPGGLVMFITSTGTMDSASARNVRKYLHERADLVTAIRFPAETFAKNAMTSVVTDLIILRKRLPGEQPGDAQWLESEKLELGGPKPTDINAWMNANRDQMLGNFNGNNRMYPGRANVDRTPDFEKRLADAIERLPRNIMSRPGQIVTDLRGIAPKASKVGGYAVKDGKLYQNGKETVREVSDASPERIERVKAMIAIRDAFDQLTEAEFGRSDEDAPSARARLNQAYDAHKDAHGVLSGPKAQAAMKGDPDLHRLTALEEYDEKTKLYSKRPIFEKSTIVPAPTGKPGSAKNIADATLISFGMRGELNVPLMAELLGLEQAEVGEQIISSGIGFQAPAGDWQLASTYLSGNVRRKLAEAEAAAKNNPFFETNVEALREVVPPYISHDKIKVVIGSPWIDGQSLKEFVGFLFGESADKYAIQYEASIGRWMVSLEGSRAKDSSVAHTTWGTSDMPFADILDTLLRGQKPKVYKDAFNAKGDLIRVLDTAGTQEAETKAEAIKEAFAKWAWDDEGRKTRLLTRYNDLLNSSIPSNYKMDWMLEADGMAQVPGMSPSWRLRGYQAEAVARTVVERRGLLAHEVGLGKTLTMIASASELKRLGIARKPAIAVPKKVLPGFVEAARKAFPLMRIQVIDSTDAATRNRTMAEVATGDYDLILMTHPNLNMLQMKPAFEAEILREELEEVEAIFRAASADVATKGASKNSAEGRLLKKIQKRVDSIRKKINDATTNAALKDNTIYFEDTGIDFLFVDEFHKYKSLPIVTALGSVKGVPTGDSQQAINMLMRARYLQKIQKGGGIVGATGTPVSNSLVEAWIMGKFLMPQEMEEAGVKSFDAWQKNFAAITDNFELDVTGKWDVKTRLSSFQNLPEAQNLSRLTLDVKTAHQTGVMEMRPKRVDQVINVPMSPTQKLYMEFIRQRAQELKQSRGAPLKGEDNFLALSSDGRMMALDPRMVLPGYTDSDGGKLKALAENVSRIYRDKPGNAQMIFSDTGTTPTAWGFNLYEEIINALVAAGIPKDKIINFSLANTDLKVEKAVSRLNSGDAAVAIGHRESMGTGINAQERMAAIHQFDVTWKPSAIEQSEARGWRAGNRNKEVEILSYVVEGSFDAVMWATVARKGKSIKDFMSGHDMGREMSDDDGETMSYETIAAIASGDMDILRKAEVEQKLHKLIAMKVAHSANITANKRGVDRIRERIAESKRSAQEMDAAIVRLKELEEKPFHFEVSYSSLGAGRTYTDRDLVANHLMSMFLFFKGTKDKTVLGRFKGRAVTSDGFGNMYVDVPTGRYSTEDRKVSVNETVFDGTLQSIERLMASDTLERRQRYLTDDLIPSLDRDLTELNAFQSAPFPREAELSALGRQLEQIDKRLKSSEADDPLAGRPLVSESGLDIAQVGRLAPKARRQREEKTPQAEIVADIEKQLIAIAANAAVDLEHWRTSRHKRAEQWIDEAGGIGEASLMALAGATQKTRQRAEAAREYDAETPVAPSQPQASSATQDDATNLLQGMLKHPDRSGLISTTELRKGYPEWSKEQFDKAVIKLVMDRKIDATAHAHPSSLTPEKRAGMVEGGPARAGDSQGQPVVYNAVSPRPGVVAETASEAAEIGKEAAGFDVSGASFWEVQSVRLKSGGSGWAVVDIDGTRKGIFPDRAKADRYLSNAQWLEGSEWDVPPVTEDTPAEHMPERIRFRLHKPHNANKPQTLWLNVYAAAAINTWRGMVRGKKITSSPFYGLLIPKAEIPHLVKTMRDMAELFDGDAAAQMLALADAIESAKDLPGGLPVMRVDGVNNRKINTLRHERGIHHAQFRLTPSGKPVGDAWIRNRPEYPSIVAGLAKMGYPESHVAIEVPAWIAARRHKEIGISDKAAREIQKAYFSAIRGARGNDALDYFSGSGILTAEVIKEIRNDRQRETGEAGRISQGNAGRSAATAAGRSAGEGASGAGRGGVEEAPAERNRQNPERGITNPLGERQHINQTTPDRALFGQEPMAFDIDKVSDEAIDAITAAYTEKRLPGTRALAIAKKLKQAKWAGRLERQQGEFIQDTVETLNRLLVSHALMEQEGNAGRRGEESYEKAKKQMNQDHLRLKKLISQVPPYSGVASYLAQIARANLLFALHILENNALSQLADVIPHEASKWLPAYPLKALKKNNLVAPETFVPKLTLQAAGDGFSAVVDELLTGIADIGRGIRDRKGAETKSLIGQIARYGENEMTTRQELARSIYKDLQSKAGATKAELPNSLKGGVDQFELGHRGRLVPGLDKFVMLAHRIHGIADVQGRTWAYSVALSSVSYQRAEALIDAQPTPPTGKPRKLAIRKLARDIAHEPDAFTELASTMESNNFVMDVENLFNEGVKAIHGGLRKHEKSDDPFARNTAKMADMALTMVVPFHRTPGAATVAKFYKYTPLAWVSSTLETRRLVKEGEAVDELRTLELTRDFQKGMFGSLAWAGLSALMMFGVVALRGGRDDDEREDALREAMGYGFAPELQIGNWTMDLTRGGSLMGQMAIAGRVGQAVRERINRDTGEREDASTRIGRTVSAAGKSLVEDSPGLRSAYDFAGTRDMGGWMARQIANRSVPGVVREGAQVQDKIARDAHGQNFGEKLGRAFTAQMPDVEGYVPEAIRPAARNTLPGRVTATGKDSVQRNPFVAAREVNPPADLRELERLGVGLPGIARLPGERESTYSIRSYEVGRSHQDVLTKVLDNPEYQKLDDEGKRGALERVLKSDSTITRAGKLSEKSLAREMTNEGKRRDALEELRADPTYQQLDGTDQKKADGEIQKFLSNYSARAKSTRAGEKPARSISNTAIDKAVGKGRARAVQLEKLRSGQVRKP